MGLVDSSGENSRENVVEGQNPQNRGFFKGLLNIRYPQVFLSVYRKLGSLTGYRHSYYYYYLFNT